MKYVIFGSIYFMVALGVDNSLRKIEGYDRPFVTSLYWPTLLGLILVEESHEAGQYLKTMELKQ